MRKNFPKEIVNTLILHLYKKGYSYRQIQETFIEVKDFDYPSLGYISKFLNETEKKKK